MDAILFADAVPAIVTLSAVRGVSLGLTCLLSTSFDVPRLGVGAYRALRRRINASYRAVLLGRSIDLLLLGATECVTSLLMH